MTTSELPPAVVDALDKPLVGPISLVLVAIVAILVITRALTEWNRHVNRELERHRLLAKIARPEVGSADSRRPPVTGWTDDRPPLDRESNPRVE